MKFRYFALVLMLILTLCACNLNAQNEDNLPTETQSAPVVPSQIPLPTNSSQPSGLPPPPLPTATGNQVESPATQQINQDIAFPSNFPDQYEVQVGSGRIVVIIYEVIINNPGRGRVFLILRDPSGAIIWRLVVTESANTSVEIPVTSSGTYQIGAAVENLEGRYSVNFSVR
jgi:hypothetical protein